jgi:hypothetical protein
MPIRTKRLRTTAAKIIRGILLALFVGVAASPKTDRNLSGARPMSPEVLELLSTEWFPPNGQLPTEPGMYQVCISRNGARLVGSERWSYFDGKAEVCWRFVSADKMMSFNKRNIPTGVGYTRLFWRGIIGPNGPLPIPYDVNTS